MLRWIWSKFRSPEYVFRNGEESSLSEDRPITSASQDKLRRTSFARSLADGLKAQRSDAGVVVALKGDWGAGKSSVKNIVKERLKETDGAETILEFNPWQWGEKDAITRAFFREVGAALGKTGDSITGRQRARSFRRYAALLETTAKTSKSIADQSGLIATAISVGFIAAGYGFFTSKPFSSSQAAGALLIASGSFALTAKIFAFFGKKPEEEELDLLKDDLQQKLRKLERNIIIIVDDIDRLEKEDIRLVFRHIKANCDLPRITFLVLFQASIVEAALGEVSESDGAGYLEKLVQASFDLPQAEDAHVRAIFEEEINRLLQGAQRFDTVRWGNMWYGALRYFFVNIRDVRRYIGPARINLHFHGGASESEVDLIDFLGLEALRTFEHAIYEGVFELRSTFLGSSEKADKGAITTLLEKCPESRREAVKTLLGNMFPNIANVITSRSYNVRWDERWNNECRICSERYFDRYFILRVPDGQISEGELRQILYHLNNGDGLDAIFANIEERGLILDVLEKLDDNVKTLFLARSKIILPLFLSIGEAQALEGGFTLRTPQIAAWRLAYHYLQLSGSYLSMCRDLCFAMEQSQAIIIGSTLIALLEDAIKDEENSNDHVLKKIYLNTMKISCLKQIEILASKPAEFINHPNFVYYLFRWKDYGDLSTVKSFIAKQIQSNNGILPIMRRFRKKSSSLTVTDFVSSQYEWFDLENIRIFYEEASIDKALAAVDETKLEDDDRATLASYRNAQKVGASQMSQSMASRR